MWLVVDANILVGELLRQRGRALFRDARLALVITDVVWGEVRHELGQRIALIERAGRVSPDAVRDLLQDALDTATFRLAVVGAREYATMEHVARRRIPRDPSDWPTVALAMTIDADIWTQDADFLGCGIPTWTTETLIAHLEEVTG